MMRRIIPAIIAKNQKELDERVNKVKKYTRFFQLDIMDGKFVKNKSLMFDFKVPRGYDYEAHLMVKNPKRWIEKNYKKVNTIIFHFESCKNSDEVLALIDLIKQKNRKVGIAFNPKTHVTKIRPFTSKVDVILIMTVKPGKYGSKFLPDSLKTVMSLRRHSLGLIIEVDGGIDRKTISKASRSGANHFVVGSYLQKSDDVDDSLEGLTRSILFKDRKSIPRI